MTPLIDLRAAFAAMLAPAGAPADPPADEEDTSDDTGESEDSAGDEGEEDDLSSDDEDDPEVEVRSSPEALLKEVKRLRQESGSRRLRNKALTAELDDLKAKAPDAGVLTSTRLELALLKANLARPAGKQFRDLDLVTNQVDASALEWDAEANSFKGLAEMLDYVADRYPYLVATDVAAAEPQGFPPVGSTSGGQRKQRNPGIDRAVLERKFPALRR